MDEEQLIAALFAKEPNGDRARVEVSEQLESPSEKFSELAFRMSLPPDWETTFENQIDDVLPPHRWTLLREYSNPVHGNRFSVRVCRIMREVNPIEAIEDYVFALGGKLVTKRVTPHIHGLLGDALFRGQTAEGGRIISRCLAMRNGAYLFNVSVDGLEDHMVSQADLILQTLRSFELLNKAESPLVETLAEITTDNPFYCRFQHPTSWTVDQTVSENEALFQLTDGPTNRLQVRICEKKHFRSAQEVGRRFIDDMSQQGIRISGAPFQSLDPTSKFHSRHGAKFEATNNKARLNAVTLICELESCWVAFELCGAVREDARLRWGVNKRAFEMMRDSWTVDPRDTESNDGQKLPDAGIAPEGHTVA